MKAGKEEPTFRNRAGPKKSALLKPSLPFLKLMTEKSLRRSIGSEGQQERSRCKASGETYLSSPFRPKKQHPQN